MFQPRIDCLLIMLLACMCMATPLHAQDRTADWLESNGLDGLLTLHLERERAESTGNAQRRERLAGRLAKVYARRLEREQDQDARTEIVKSAERLLATGELVDEEALRLALMRSQYLRASGVLESGRAALAEADDIAAAQVEIGDLANRFAALRESLDARIRRANLKLDRATGLRARRLQEIVDEYRNLDMSAALLHGWSLYYDGRFERNQDQLRKAEMAFGLVLNGEREISRPEDISTDLQEFEFYASAMLGMALTVSNLDGYRSAMPWFDRLDLPVTHVTIRDGADGWRIAGALDANDHPSALAVVESLAGRADVPAAWLRIAAVHGLESESMQGRQLATRALALLASNGELSQVSDLADQYGLEALGDSGFAFRYVRAIQAYREAVGHRDAGRSSEARTAFEQAAEEFLAATGESDIDQFPQAMSGSYALAGWSLVELGRFQDAVTAFMEAANRSQGDRRADAEWGAIVALDRLIANGGKGEEELRVRRDELIAAFLDRFPADDRAPSLVVRRIADRDETSSSDVETLLQVPRNHSTWEMARRRAAQALYTRFRESPRGSRGRDGLAFLDVAEELLSRDRAEQFMNIDVGGLDGVLLRQAVEVATNPEVADVTRASRWLATLELAGERGAFEAHPDLPNELAYRRMSLAMNRQDIDDAIAQLQRMPIVRGTPDAEEWTRIAARRLHRDAYEQLRSSEGASAKVANAVVVAGEQLLDPGAEGELNVVLENPRLLPIAASVAAARHALYLAGGDQEDGEKALAMYQAVLEKRPKDASILVASAEISRSLGDLDTSIVLWRSIAAQSPQGQERWWKARTNLLELLGMTDPERAREVLAQHLQMHPNHGPEPWGDRLRSLENELDLAEAASNASTPEGAGS